MRSRSSESRSVRPALRAILDSIAGIQDVLAGKSLAEYSSDWMTYRAVERGMEIISEASRRIPAALRNQRPEIEWQQISGLGNVLRHNYDDVRDEIIFDAAQKKLDGLKAAILAMEASLDEPKE